MDMKHIIEAWRDEEYRERLDAEACLRLPANPAGEIELAEAELAEVDGGLNSTVHMTLMGCTYPTL